MNVRIRCTNCGKVLDARPIVEQGYYVLPIHGGCDNTTVNFPLHWF